MGRMLYLECASGISGDMAVAALLDLGASEERLRNALDSLPVDGFEVRVSRVKKSGLDACDFDVVLDSAHENHDHDMAYLHGGGDEVARLSGGGLDDGCAHAHHHEHGHHAHESDERDHHEHGHHHERAPHEHDHHHEHDAHGHHHEHRGMPEIEAIIRDADITDRAKEIALRIFGIIARAEAKAHGVPADQVHFHEVGAVDSIVDVVSFAVCFDDLGLDDVVVERLCEGRGTVRCQHGVLPVPVPAVSHVVAEAGIPLSIMDVQGEFVTPTGAAIAAAVRTRDALPARFTVERIGLGAGKREYAVPSLLRAMIIQEELKKESDNPIASGRWAASNEVRFGLDEACAMNEAHIWKLECDVDDCTGEALGFTMERLFAAGAREAHFMPIYMKKNRPAWQIQVICTRDLIPTMEAELFAHTTTIGIRRTPMERTVLPREELRVSTPFGSARAKRVTLPDGRRRTTPEHDSVQALVEASESAPEEAVSDDALQRSLTYQEAYALVLRAAEAIEG